MQSIYYMYILCRENDQILDIIIIKITINSKSPFFTMTYQQISDLSCLV